MSDNLMLIAASEAKSAVEAAVAKDPTLDLPGRLRAAFGATRRHWLVTDPDARFRAGVGGVLLTASEDEKVRIEAELLSLRALAAATSGIPVDLDALFGGERPEPIGLMTIWRENP